MAAAPRGEPAVAPASSVPAGMLTPTAGKDHPAAPQLSELPQPASFWKAKHSFTQIFDPFSASEQQVVPSH